MLDSDTSARQAAYWIQRHKHGPTAKLAAALGAALAAAAALPDGAAHVAGAFCWCRRRQARQRSTANAWRSIKSFSSSTRQARRAVSGRGAARGSLALRCSAVVGYRCGRATPARLPVCPLQGQAEHYLEKLHHKVEKDLSRFLKAKPQPGGEGDGMGSGDGARGGADEPASGGGGEAGPSAGGDQQAVWNTFRWVQGLAGSSVVSSLSQPKRVCMQLHPPPCVSRCPAAAMHDRPPAPHTRPNPHPLPALPGSCRDGPARCA